jgi:hypothetical protein
MEPRSPSIGAVFSIGSAPKIFGAAVPASISPKSKSEGPMGRDRGLDDLRRMSARELAQYKAGWRVGTEQWILADAEQRRRDGWSGPVKLSLVISFAAVLLSVIALATK